VHGCYTSEHDIVRYREFFKESLELHNKWGGLEDGNPAAGPRGGAPVGGLKDEVPQKLKHIVVYCNKF